MIKLLGNIGKLINWINSYNLVRERERQVGQKIFSMDKKISTTQLTS